jgi:hypothetical protein
MGEHDNFLIGVTRTKLFITRFKVTLPFVECFVIDRKIHLNIYSFYSIVSRRFI